MELFGYLSSFFMGLSLGLIGGGGSILTVPILVYLFSVDPIVATSTSLFIVGSTALLGAILAWRRNDVHLKMSFQFAIPSVIGVYVMKTYLVPSIPNVIFSLGPFTLTKPLLIMGLFAFLMLLASLAMIRKKKGHQAHVMTSASTKSYGFIIKLATQGLFIGGVTGLVGAGGGFLIVPALVTLVGLNMRSAIGTSLLIIAMNSLFGFSIALSHGLMVEWLVLLTILGIALMGLTVGSYLSYRVPEGKLKMGFGYFVLIMGSLILFDQIRKL